MDTFNDIRIVGLFNRFIDSYFYHDNNNMLSNTVYNIVHNTYVRKLWENTNIVVCSKVTYRLMTTKLSPSVFGFFAQDKIIII